MTTAASQSLRAFATCDGGTKKKRDPSSPEYQTMLQRDQIWMGLEGSQKPESGWEIDEGHPYAPNRMAYLFNEGGGIQVNDLVRGHAGKATLTTGAYNPWGQGNAGGAIQFRQLGTVNGRLQFGGASFGVTSWFALWVYPAGQAWPTYQALLANSGGSAELTYRGDTHKLDFVFSAHDHFSTASLPTGQWSHILVNALGDAQSTVQIVINGKLDSAFTGWPGFVVVQIGDDGFGDFFTGAIESAIGSDGVSLPASYWPRLYSNSYDWLVPPSAHRYDFCTVTPPPPPPPPAVAHTALKWFPGLDRRARSQRRAGR